MTAWGTIDLAVEAMRLGAGDFIEKPWDNQRLMSVIRNQLALADSRGEAARLKRENEILRGDDDEPFIAESASMKSVLAQLDRVAPTDANVLILGENGTGKGVVARRLHRALAARVAAARQGQHGRHSRIGVRGRDVRPRARRVHGRQDRSHRPLRARRRRQPLLDEIANIPLAQQPKLLRVLEDGELERVGSSRTLKVDVRLISATNADLNAEIARGAFRRDLLFRLNTVELKLPPLRERDEDIALLAESFLAHFAQALPARRAQVRAVGAAALRSYAWPGNVRELSHVIERAVLMLDGDMVDDAALNLKPEATHALSGAAALAATGSMTVDEAEEQLVRQALERTGGNIQRAATLLGLSRPSLYRRMEKYGIE